MEGDDGAGVRNRGNARQPEKILFNVERREERNNIKDEAISTLSVLFAHGNERRRS